jgi:hypothetical protein
MTGTGHGLVETPQSLSLVFTEVEEYRVRPHILGVGADPRDGLIVLRKNFSSLAATDTTPV